MKKNYILFLVALVIVSFSAKAQTVTLYEQITDVGATSGIISDYITNDSKGTYSADDFVLTADSNIETIFIPGFQNNGDITTIGTAIDIFIYADNGGIPASNPNNAGTGALEITNLAINDASISVTDNDFTIDITAANGGTAVNLPAGTYWLSFVVHVPVLDDRWNWFQGSASDTQNAQILDDGNFGGGFDWTAFTGVGLSFGSLAFRIEGSVTASTTDNILNAIEINPNPVLNTLNIQSDVAIKSIKLFSISGKLVYNGTFANSLDVSKLEKGVYLVNIDTENGTIVKKMIKK